MDTTERQQSPDIERFARGLRVTSETAEALVKTFTIEIAPAVIEEAKALTVSDESETQKMAQAHTLRIQLKTERNRIEQTRKLAKEESLRKGQAIDAVANYLKGLIEPVEKHLQAQEDFIKIRDAERRAARKIERERLLSPYVETTIHFDLEYMSDEGFTSLLESSQIAHETRQREIQERETARLEAERIEREEKEKLRAEYAESERLRLEAEAREKNANEERRRAEGELQKKLDDEASEKRRIELEAESAAMAPDKEKLLKFAEMLDGIQMPAVVGTAAHDIIRDAHGTLDYLAKAIRIKVEDM